jgi:hypothetical protein
MSRPRSAKIGFWGRTKHQGRKDTTGILYGDGIVIIAHHAPLVRDQPVGVLRDP